MSRPASRANSRPPSRPASRAASVSSSVRTRESQPRDTRGGQADLSVTLRDCDHLIRQGIVGLPGGVTKTGCPLIIFPNTFRFHEILESDLHLLLTYLVSITPRTHDTTPGFALLIDRATESWPTIQAVFTKVISVFPATIKEVFLVYKYPAGGAMLGQLVDSNYLLDFDIFHVSAVTELLHYIDPKYLSSDLGGSNGCQVDAWINTQYHVDQFTGNATKTARKLSSFMRILHQENESQDVLELAERNRNYFHQLRQELEAVQTHGIRIIEAVKSQQDQGARTSMQIMSVRRLCSQLETTWQYFTNTFRMQDQLYVQNIELARFCSQFREIANKFAENEKVIESLIVVGNNLYEVNELLDKFDNITETLNEDIEAAVALSKVGSDLILEHEFARDSLEPKCTQLRIMCKTQEILLLEKRQTLMKFMDLFEGLSSLTTWCSTASHHLNLARDQDRDNCLLTQIRQIDYLLSKARGMKIKSRVDFEEDFDDIKHLITAKTLFAVGDKIKQFEEVKRNVTNRRAQLRNKAESTGDGKQPIHKDNQGEDNHERREKILDELLSTEENYVDDLNSVLYGYRDRFDEEGEDFKQKADMIFGNMEEIFEFHSQCLLPDLERCSEDLRQVAKTFLEYSENIKKIYCSYCGNMENARMVVESLGDDNLLLSCQQQLGHQLPLSSYLLKPVQRLTKYQLLLKDLSLACPNGSTKYTLELSLQSILNVIKSVNDSLHTPNIKSLPTSLQPLGSLICQETFNVTSENKSQSQLLFRKNGQRRHVLLYENHLIFCKQMERGEDVFTFKMSLPVGNLGMSSVIKGEDRKMEVWVIGQPDAFILEAKSKKSKDFFAGELRKMIAKERGNNRQEKRTVRNVMSSETLSATSGSVASDTSRQYYTHRTSFSRARSLDGDSWSRTYQDSSGLSSSVEQLDSARYSVLADYTALTARELNLHLGEVVELIKQGCAGWWYVRLEQYPYTEGWAPATYLERIATREQSVSRNKRNRNRTLDRF